MASIAWLFEDIRLSDLSNEAETELALQPFSPDNHSLFDVHLWGTEQEL